MSGSWLMRAVRVAWPVGVLLGAVALGCGSTAQNPRAAGGAAGDPPVGSGGQGASTSHAGMSAGGSATQGGSSQAGATAMGGASAGSGTGGSAGPAEPVFPKLIQDCDVPTAHERADAGLASLLTNFWSGADQYMYATSTPGALTGYWTYAQAFDALLDGVERTGGLRYRGMIRSFYDGRDLQGWLVNYYDDETWMTLALLRAYDLTGEKLYLEQAEEIYADIMAAWDTTCCGQYLGGIWWNKSHQQKATASNAGPVIAGVRLAERTKDSKYADFAKQAYDFWWKNMTNQQTFAIYDHISPNGTRSPGSLTYNHGLMISAALELHRTTGEAHFLDEAHGFGQYLVDHATRDSSVGPLLHDALGQTCDGDCPAWKGIGYRYLAQLFREDTTKAAYLDVLTAGPEGIWTLARSAQNDFFATNWDGPPPTIGGIEEQGSAVMALNIYAMLCGSDSKPVTTPGRYEAEEAWLDHVALEAKYAGFSGFGYVAAFVTTSQSVTFYVDVPADGDYHLDWTYSAAAGNAMRSIYVDDAIVAPSQQFASTGAWDTWKVGTTNAPLLKGPHTIKLAFVDPGSGGLNLDRLDIVPN